MPYTITHDWGLQVIGLHSALVAESVGKAGR
jgi:hypothetical protein